MSENKFIRHLQGKNTAKSVLEIRNQNTPTSFANMPDGSTSNANDVYSDHRGDAAGVLKGTDNWKLNGANLVFAQNPKGNGLDYINSFMVAGAALWVNASYTFTSPKTFGPYTKYVLKLCGDNLSTFSSDTVDFTLLVKLGPATIATKNFTVTTQAFTFCKEFEIDFEEGNATAVKAATNDKLTVQLLCSDPNAQATIYNGMTIFTVLQRRVDSETVMSDTLTLDEIEYDLTTHIADKNNPHEVTKAQVGLGNCDNTSDLDKPVSTAQQTALDGKVNKSGDTMSGTLWFRFLGTGSYKVGISQLGSHSMVFADATYGNGSFVMDFQNKTLGPRVTDIAHIGTSSLRWADAYINKVYTGVINNGYDIAIPVTNSADTLALKSEVDLAANSGRMITDQGLWYAKMYAATVVPSADDDTNYADFSQTDGQGNPIIVTYNCVNGAWVQDQTITPPADYDGYVSITSKIWDITEQDGQQGGRILWNHQSKEFTPYPQIISLEDAALTGTPTAPTLNASSPSDQIVNKQALENALVNHGTGRNVGDIFYTMRNDNELNGAVECDGATYNTTDFTGAQSIGSLLTAGKVPYLSLADYATALATDGSVGVFGWDGENTTTFRVPSLNDIFVETGTAAQLGDFVPAGLPDHYHNVRYRRNDNSGYHAEGSVSPHIYTGSNLKGSYPSLNASESNSIYGNSNTVQPKSVRYRAMVQLATSATDEAVETCTSVLALLANGDYVVDFQAPTAANNYTWYRKYKSGWVEQGKEVTFTTTEQETTLPVTMASTHYSVWVAKGSGNGNFSYCWAETSSTVRYKTSAGSNQPNSIVVCGMAA